MRSLVVLRRSQLMTYVDDLNCMSRLFNALFLKQFVGERAGFVGLCGCFCWENKSVYLCRAPYKRYRGARFAVYLQRTISNSNQLHASNFMLDPPLQSLAGRHAPVLIGVSLVTNYQQSLPSLTPCLQTSPFRRLKCQHS